MKTTWIILTIIGPRAIRSGCLHLAAKWAEENIAHVIGARLPKSERELRKFGVKELEV